jgi:4,5-dihydroxyphthalate decarboxylase
MHIVGIRRTLAEQHSWLPAGVMKAFEQAKSLALARMGDLAASKVTSPFIEERLLAARQSSATGEPNMQRPDRAEIMTSG